MLHAELRPLKRNEVFITTQEISNLFDRLDNDTLPQTILFHGDVGTGKTTIARMLAMGLNCDDIHRPCGECVYCKSIDSYTTMLNAGDKRGIDDIRDILSTATQPSLTGRNNIIIIDEAGGLTPQAQRALREITEAPPKGVYIFLATSEVEKINKDIKDRVYSVFMPQLSDKQIKDFITFTSSRLGLDKDLKDLVWLCITRDIRSPRKIITLIDKASKNEEIIEDADVSEDIYKLYNSIINGDWKTITTQLKSISSKKPVQNIYDHLVNLASYKLVNENNRSNNIKHYRVLSTLIDPPLNITNQKADLIYRLSKIFTQIKGG